MPRPTDGKFTFTVNDLALFLGKSPATIRKWDVDGVVVLPRDKNGDRKLTTEQLREVAQEATKIKRVHKSRLQLIESAITMLELLENLEKERRNGKDRDNRSTRIR